MKSQSSFAVRRYVTNPGVPNRQIQAMYDSINLFAHVLGSMPFRKLYSTPIRSLAPMITQRIRNHPDFVQVKEGIEDAVQNLADAAGDLALGSLFTKSSSELGKPCVRALKTLRSLGFRLPVLLNDGKATKNTAAVGQKILTDLMTHAGDIVFTDLFSKPKSDFSDATVKAVAALSGNGFWPFGNDSCCRHGAYGDYCVYRRRASCYLLPATQTPNSEDLLCTLGSTRC